MHSSFTHAPLHCFLDNSVSSLIPYVPRQVHPVDPHPPPPEGRLPGPPVQPLLGGLRHDPLVRRRAAVPQGAPEDVPHHGDRRVIDGGPPEDEVRDGRHEVAGEAGVADAPS